MNLFNIARAYRQKKERNWNHVYWMIDLHDVLIPGGYNRYNAGRKLYPGAQEVLSHLGSPYRSECLILWTSSHADAIIDMRYWLKDQGIVFHHVNENPLERNTELCDFDAKPYFNILLDDKAGFEGETDWLLIKAELQRIGEWTIFP